MTREACGRHRPLPGMGIVALLVDGADPAQLAAAFDIPTRKVKQYVNAALTELCVRIGARPVQITGRAQIAGNNLWKHSYHLHTLLGERTHWLDLLFEKEQVEVIECRAYFRAFRNSPNAVVQQEHTKWQNSN